MGITGSSSKCVLSEMVVGRGKPPFLTCNFLTLNYGSES